MWIAITLLSVGFAVSLVGIGVLWWHRGQLRAQNEQLSGELAASREVNETLRGQNAELGRDVAVAQETQKGLEKRIAEAHEQLREAFKSLAGDVLKQSNQQFLQLAKQVFEGEQKSATGELEKRKQAIESLVKPVRETLEKTNSALQEAEKARQRSEGALREQLAALLTDQAKLRDETARLVNALRRPQVRGRWGELQLKRVVEMAGMNEYCDFREQVSMAGEDSTSRPDMVVDLPGERNIVVDAKTPLEAYISAVDAEDDGERQRFMEQHAVQVEAHVRKLSGKQYFAQFSRSPDFVVLFLPGESFLYAAVHHRPELVEKALNQRVVIATPMTLVALLKVVALGWREAKIAENAQRVQGIGQELYDRLCTMMEHLQSVGRGLEQTVDRYNKAVGSLESRVLPSARKFKDLGVSTSKQLPEEGEVKQVDLLPRDIRSEEPT